MSNCELIKDNTKKFKTEFSCKITLRENEQLMEDMNIKELVEWLRKCPCQMHAWATQLADIIENK